MEYLLIEHTDDYFYAVDPAPKKKNVFLYFVQTLKIQIGYFPVKEHKLNFKIDKYVLLEGAIIPKACN